MGHLGGAVVSTLACHLHNPASNPGLFLGGFFLYIFTWIQSGFVFFGFIIHPWHWGPPYHDMCLCVSMNWLFPCWIGHLTLFTAVTSTFSGHQYEDRLTLYCFSSVHWPEPVSVCSRWSMAMTCSPPLRAYRRPVQLSGSLVRSICMSSLGSLSTLYSTCLLLWSWTPMRLSR